MHELEVLVGHQFSLLTFSTPSYLEKHEISMMMPFFLNRHQVLVGHKLVVANAGDSRGVLCRNGIATALSEDHKPSQVVKHGDLAREMRVVQFVKK